MIVLSERICWAELCLHDLTQWRFVNITFCISVTENFSFLCFWFDCGFGWVGLLSLFLSWKIRNLDQTVFDSWGFVSDFSSSCFFAFLFSTVKIWNYIKSPPSDLLNKQCLNLETVCVLNIIREWYLSLLKDVHILKIE